MLLKNAMSKGKALETKQCDQHGWIRVWVGTASLPAKDWQTRESLRNEWHGQRKWKRGRKEIS